MMIFYIADTHFGDQRIMHLAKRPFDDLAKMDATIVARWNAKVSPTDTVYVVGDFAIDDAKAKSVLPLLNGTKHLIVGNHDDLADDTKAQFASVNQILTIIDNDRSVCLCHYPLLSFENSIYGGYHVFGHIHNNSNDIAYNLIKTIPRIFNCGVDENNFEPKTLDELSRGKI